jgi:hypothetical protein
MDWIFESSAPDFIINAGKTIYEDWSPQDILDTNQTNPTNH